MKLPQTAVSYRPSTDPARRCDACTMYQDRACTRVKGPIDPGGTCDIFYPADLAPAAAEAYLTGWALTDTPFTGRIEAGCYAAVQTALDHRHDPGVLEVALQLGHLEGIWATVYQRRARLQRKHERAIAAAWKACIAGLDPGDVARWFRRDTYQPSEAATKDPTKKWWQDVAIAAALAWLRAVYHTDGFDALVTALADAIRAGMAEGEADALALAASRQGRTGFRIADAFQAAYDRLAADHTIEQRAQAAVTGIIDATAGDVGRRLASLAGDGAGQDDMTGGASDVMGAAQAVRAHVGDLIWSVAGAAALSLFSRASQPPPGSTDSGFTVLVDWNSEPSACIICQDNTANGPYAPQDVPPYLAHPNCRCWLSSATGLPAWMLAAWLAGDD